MADLFEMMIGAPPSGPEETRAAAKQLRRQQRQAMLGMSTGDAVMGQTGKLAYDQVQNQLQGLQQSRQNAIATQTQQDRWDTTDQQLADQRAQTQKNWEERMGFDRDKLEQGNALKLAVQQMKSQQTGKEQRRYRQALSRDLTKAGIPEMNRSIAIVDEALKPYAGKNLPGFGSGKYDPSDEARALRGKLSGVENVLLKARSGAAVTEPEYERFRKELLGEGILATDADFRRSWADLKAKIAAAEDGIVRGYDPDVVALYYGRTGATPEPEAAATTVTPDPGIVMGSAESYLQGM